MNLLASFERSGWTEVLLVWREVSEEQPCWMLQSPKEKESTSWLISIGRFLSPLNVPVLIPESCSGGRHRPARWVDAALNRNRSLWQFDESRVASINRGWEPIHSSVPLRPAGTVGSETKFPDLEKFCNKLWRLFCRMINSLVSATFLLQIDVFNIDITYTWPCVTLFQEKNSFLAIDWKAYRV